MCIRDRRYTPAGGRVTARVVAQGDFALLEIEDSGPGISDEESHKVFDRFYRGEGTDGEGSGLGLAIVREIAEPVSYTHLVRRAKNRKSCVFFSLRMTESLLMAFAAHCGTRAMRSIAPTMASTRIRR